MKIQIVVARYNENIDHLDFFNDITVVYNKGNDNINQIYKNVIKLINVGREAHTYLYHIINNYNNLAERTFFMQAKTDDHKMLEFIEYFKDKYFIGKISNLYTKLLKKPIDFDKKYLISHKNNFLLRSKYIPYQFIKNILGIDISNDNKFDMIWGANFVVSRDLIHKKPIEFYINIIKYLEFYNNPEEGHFFERSWYLIYNHPNFIKKDKILYYYCENITMNIIKKCDEINMDNYDIDEIHLWTNNYKILDKNNIVDVKYLSNYQYITIYPIIKNNSFTFYYTNSCDLILEFDKNTYEIIFTPNFINVYYVLPETHVEVQELEQMRKLPLSVINNKFIIKYPLKKMVKYSFLIKWDNDNLYIGNFNIKFESIISEIINIKVKSFDSLINYNINEVYYKRTFIFYTVLNRVNKLFYNNNFEDKYTFELNQNYLL